MTKRLENKVALITGGTTGIGLATARRFHAEGATVIVTGRNPDTLTQAAEEMKGVAEVIASDASDPAAVAALFAHIEQAHGHLDVLFLNAGIAQFAPLDEAPEAQFDALFAVNVKGPWLALKAAVPLLRDGASVIVNTSVAGQKGMQGASLYGATKAALAAFVRSAASELSARGIRVNAVSPGPITTPIYGKLGLPQEAVEGFAEGILSQVPLARFGEADELANAVLFLASHEASFVQGVELNVDGGLAAI